MFTPRAIKDIGILSHLDSNAHTYNLETLTPLTGALFTDLINAGVSQAAIARLWNVSNNTARDWIKHFYNEGLGDKDWRKKYKVSLQFASK